MIFKLEKRPSDSKAMAYLSPVLAVLLTLISGAIVFASLGHDPLGSLYVFFLQPLEDLYGWTELGIKVAPLLLCAMGLMLCFKAQVWNIGAEGQFILGGLGGGFLALQLGDVESYWVLPAVLLFGSLCGLAWAALAAWLKTRFSANEILTTIMLNYIALYFLYYGVHGPLKDPDGFNFPESALFSDFAMLPVIFEDYRLTISILFALFAVAVIWTFMSRAMLGFQINVLGQDPSAASFAGFKDKKLVWLVLLICGALAGLAGVSEVTGPVGQLNPYIAPGYGYAAIIIVFLGRMHPGGIVIASMLLALTYMGGEMVQMDLTLPKSITGLFQGMLLFYLLACDLLISYRIVRDRPVQTKSSSNQQETAQA
ncbi:sugar ABC transporter permease [Oleiphilus sp. HI0009]|uniref:ABC transporter permease n=1 Tax=unclassified Oleiphilus TaxID=2631174 RepID=UPI0007C40049|nr:MULTISPECIES: ABC transporter permease [unclassified Oleiphilus]KZX79418.1 sugar ABC transporter permease [Oleiphilus sp. HI0009]MCH2157463.1 ABC transporter permease [Oleiphilaceae bacterium]KZY63042.1 sugar ABC transporter permease [Oleiphilus sp. HI0066]KZY75426.1 sugar ABC transporter permease [Oleiphilus sp. HI0067]KZZ61579.1 sugar ABC transporter permease [Oleiphilus sp. HI0125]